MLSDTDIDTLQRELEQARDDRDLYRGLLRIEPTELTDFVAETEETIDRIRALIRQSARDSGAFRHKIGRLLDECSALGARVATLPLPSLVGRIEAARQALQAMQTRAQLSGNDLLPAIALLEAAFAHLAPAYELRGRRPIRRARRLRPTSREPDSASMSKLAQALQQLTDQLAAEHDKCIGLNALGLEQIPPEWTGPLFDVLSQLLRNAAEHGIEPATLRDERGKSTAGALLVEFAARGPGTFELIFQDDGQGLDAERIMDIAIERGLLRADDDVGRDPRRAASLIFQPGLTTAANAAARGFGMQIVRDQVRRLGGHMQVATKRGQFTRIRIRLPALDSVMPAPAEARA